VIGKLMTKTLPMVTIGIPCLNEEAFIEHTVTCALEQDYPADKLEVIVADGGSTDATLEILARVGRAEPRVTTIHNPGKIQAAGLNEIIRRARGDVLVRLDAHADYAVDYVRNCVAVLERTGADNVGGAQRPRAKTSFQRALCAALESPLGVGGAKYRSADNEGFVDTVFIGAFRRRVFEVVGLYDPKAVTNEDAELNQRILQTGGRIYLSRDIVAHYYPRSSLSALAKQYFRYGSGRARTLLKHRHLPTIRPLVPFGFVVGGLALLATRALHPLTAPAIACYAALTGIEALRVGRRAGWSSIPVVWSIFPVLHISHGVGMAYGIVRYLSQPDWNDPELLAPRSPA
jgi:succinoglycan biosynthesis protein ExoA